MMNVSLPCCKGNTFFGHEFRCAKIFWLGGMGGLSTDFPPCAEIPQCIAITQHFKLCIQMRTIIDKVFVVTSGYVTILFEQGIYAFFELTQLNEFGSIVSLQTSRFAKSKYSAQKVCHNYITSYLLTLFFGFLTIPIHSAWLLECLSRSTFDRLAHPRTFLEGLSTVYARSMLRYRVKLFSTFIS